MRHEQASLGSTDAEEVVLAEIDQDSIGSPNRSFIERLLSPESLQWMMACGSGLLVLGFVVWLWSTGVFEQPLVVAACCGTATLAFIGAGVGMVLKTRHQLAGRWLTLVGALAMPLNLWLYDAQGLITIAEGGHLWIPAAICCAFYAGIARVLRDSTFVYAFVGGIVLTGMLFLADQSIGRFWEWMPPAKFLIVIGWISVFAERLFTKDEKSDFSQKNFGSAFYRSGLVVVVCGLGLVLGGFGSVFGSSIFVGADFWPLTLIATDQKIWALILVAASAAGFFVQGILKKSTTCHWSGLALVVWAVLIAMNLLSIALTSTLFAILAATVIIIRNVTGGIVQSGADKQNTTARTGSIGSNLGVGMLSLMAFVQMLVHLEGSNFILFPPAFTWWTVLQFLLTAVAAWTLAWRVRLYSDENSDRVNGCVAVGGIIAMLTVWAAITLQSAFAIPTLAIVASAIPLVLGVVGIFGLKDNPLFKMLSATRIAGIAMITTHMVLLGACDLLPGFVVANTHLVWIAALGAASFVYGLASRSIWPTANKVLSLVSAIGCVAVLGHYFGFEFGYCVILAPAIIGTGIKLIYFFVGETAEAVRASARSKKKNPLVAAANFIVLQAGAAGVLLAMSRWLEGNVSSTLLVVMLTVLACTVVSSLLTKNDYWKTIFRTLILAIVGSSICVLDGLLNLDGWHRGEICSLVGGVILLVLGHLAWVREGDEDADTVATASLFTGSLLIVIPLAIGVVFYRTAGLDETHWRLFHEVSAIAGSLVLLAAGILCRVRSTTIGGAVLMMVYLGSLVTLIRISSQLQNASVAMMIGGAVFLTTAILMSIYRDRLVALPGKVADGEGVFQVLKWR